MRIITITAELLCKTDVFLISIIFGFNCLRKEEAQVQGIIPVVDLYYCEHRERDYEESFVSVTGFQSVGITEIS